MCCGLLPQYKYSYFLNYLAVTASLQPRYRSWPQLICVHHELLQLVANFGYPALLHSQQCPFLRLPAAGTDSKTLRTGLKLSIRATLPSHRRRCTGSKSSYISYSSIVWAILLYSRKVHKSYIGFYSRRRLMLAHMKLSTSRSQHHIIKPAIWETYKENSKVTGLNKKQVKKYSRSSTTMNTYFLFYYF